MLANELCSFKYTTVNHKTVFSRIDVTPQYVCMYVYMHVFVCMHVRMYIRMYVSMYVRMHVRIHVFRYVNIRM